MCGRYAATLPPEMMVELFKLLNEIDYPPRYNIKPTEPIIAIWQQMGRRTAQLVRWGLIPAWVKDPREWPLIINARSDGLLEKPSFKTAMRNSRCIIPADGYYEWMKGPDGKRQPYFITSVGNEPMAFAGLYAQWMGPNGEETDSAAIVTVPPNLEISGVYDRMPAILHGDAIDMWLDTANVSDRDAAALAVSPPPETMKYWPVGKAVGQKDAEGPDLIRPLKAEAAEVQPGEGVDDEAAKPKRKKAAGGGQLDLF